MVKLQETGDPRAVPSLARIDPSSLAVYAVEIASCALGVSVAMFDAESYDTVAGIEPPGPESVNVAPLNDEASMARENVAVTCVACWTPVAPPTGEVALTVGAAGADAGEASMSTK